MIRPRLLNQSLANRYTLLATLLVLLTTLLLGFASASGVYRMALREESARQRAQREFVMSEVSGRLQTSGRVLRTLTSRDVLKAGTETDTRRALATVFAANAEYLHGVAVVRDGQVLSEYPAGSVGDSDAVRALAAQASPVEVYTWVASADGRGGSLWLTVQLGTTNGEQRVLLGKIRTTFIDVALKQLALTEGQPTVFFADASGSMLFAAGDPDAYRTGRVTYAAAANSAALGTAEISVGDSVRYLGVYGDLVGLPGLTWRCVVVEPIEFVVEETWRALRPAILVWGFVAVCVSGVAVAGMAYLVRPLRLLDSQARAAASGALLEPLEVNRRDEVGRLIESFNSVAERLRRMHDVSQLLARSVNRGEVLDGIISSLTQMLDARDVDVYLSEDDSHALRLVRTTSLRPDRLGTLVRAADSPWLRRTLDTKAVESFRATPGMMPLMIPHVTGATHACGVAVAFVKGAEVLGVVVAACDSDRAFSKAETEMMRSFAAQASVALDNARLFAEEHRSRREAEVLRRTAELLSGPEDLRAALKQVAAVEAEALGMATSFVALAGADTHGATPPDDALLESRLLAFWDERRSNGVDATPVALDAESEVGCVCDSRVPRGRALPPGHADLPGRTACGSDRARRRREGVAARAGTLCRSPRRSGSRSVWRSM